MGVPRQWKNILGHQRTLSSAGCAAASGHSGFAERRWSRMPLRSMLSYDAAAPKDRGQRVMNGRAVSTAPIPMGAEILISCNFACHEIVFFCILF